MGFKCGIVGLPNVGKSTLFNALTKAGAATQNYPFCTIEPNTGVVTVPDPRLDAIVSLVNPKTVVPSTMTFVDIAGLIKGASQGEGLGNQFLSHIREMDALVHVVRCFDSEDIAHAHGKVSPRLDIETVNLELILADLQQAERLLDRFKKLVKTGDREVRDLVSNAEACIQILEQEVPLREANIDLLSLQQNSSISFLTVKPIMYVANVSDSMMESTNYVDQVRTVAETEKSEYLVLCSKVEEELQELDESERDEYASEMGIEELGIKKLSRVGQQILDLITFFTIRNNEVRAWTVKQGTIAYEAAGKIHTDFQKGFIRAEVIHFNDFAECGGELAAKQAGLMRLEGKEYIVQNGDVIYFRFNV